MAMSDADQEMSVKHLVRKIYSELGATATCNVTDLKAAVSAINDALETTCGSFAGTDSIEVALNKQIPEPAKSNLTQAQKGMLLAYTAMKKYDVI